MAALQQPRGGKKAWQPSNQVKQLLAVTAGKLISLPPGERQWFLNQLRVFDKKQKKTNSKQSKARSKTKKKSQPEKSDWKKAWHASQAYKDWQAAVTPKGQDKPSDAESQEKFLELRNRAFRERDALKAKLNETKISETPAGSPAGQSSATEDNSPPEQKSAEVQEQTPPQEGQDGTGQLPPPGKHKTIKLKSRPAVGSVKNGKYATTGKQAPSLQIAK